MYTIQNNAKEMTADYKYNIVTLNNFDHFITGCPIQ